MNKILAALNRSTVEKKAVAPESPEEAQYYLNKVKMELDMSDCPKDITEWFDTALSKISKGESADHAFGLIRSGGRRKRLTEDIEAILYESFVDNDGKHHKTETKSKTAVTYRTVAEKFNLTPNTVINIIERQKIKADHLQAILQEVLEDLQ